MNRPFNYRELHTIDKCIDCGHDYIVNSSSQLRCNTCSKMYFKKLRNKAAIEHYHKQKTGNYQQIIGATIICICGKKFIRTSPTRTRCLNCQLNRRRSISKLSDKRRKLLRKYRNAIKKTNKLTCRCGQLFNYNLSKKFCNECGNIRRLFRSTLSRIKKTRSNRRSIPLRCEISTEDLYKIWLKQKGMCALTQLKMKTKGIKMVSVDRIKSHIGYINSNIHLVCQWANLGKWIYSVKTFQDIILEIKAQVTRTII